MTLIGSERAEQLVLQLNEQFGKFGLFQISKIMGADKPIITCKNNPDADTLMDLTGGNSIVGGLLSKYTNGNISVSIEERQNNGLELAFVDPTITGLRGPITPEKLADDVRAIIVARTSSAIESHVSRETEFGVKALKEAYDITGAANRTVSITSFDALLEAAKKQKG